MIPRSEDPLEKGMGTLQYPCMENPMFRGAWWATVHGVAKTEQLTHTHTHTHTPLVYKGKYISVFLESFSLPDKSQVSKSKDSCILVSGWNHNTKVTTAILPP